MLRQPYADLQAPTIVLGEHRTLEENPRHFFLRNDALLRGISIVMSLGSPNLTLPYRINSTRRRYELIVWFYHGSGGGYCASGTLPTRWEAQPNLTLKAW